ncbi:DUF6880 family protein [Phenylobacterium sp.]|uniref:DUF6880 family protein n=1 Tax=Phenylobacterium sp. TaxID=1871053 RepID=UPI00289D5FB4|nr:DUF6880 family protein [Phenylobacterium sp.]
MTPTPRAAKRSGSRKTLTQANLEALGAEKLALLLLAAAEEDAHLKRRLRMNLAGEVGAEDLAGEVAKRMAALEARRARVSARGYKGFARDLDLQRAMIVGPLAGLDPGLALAHLCRFLAMGPAMLSLTRDPRGLVADVFAAAAQSAPALVKVARVEPATVARALGALVEGDRGGLYPDLLEQVAPGLEAAARKALRTELEQRWGEHRRMDRLRRAVRLLADLDADVDAYLATFTDAERSEPETGGTIARRLIAAGRLQEAEAALRSAAPKQGVGQGRAAWEDAQIALAEAQGRPDEAQELRWAAFERALRTAPLRDHLKRLSGFDDVEAEERAMASAKAHARFSDALAFLIAWPSIPDAAQLVLERAGEIDPARTELLEAAADLLEARHPIAASLLLRAMIVDTLRWRRTDRAQAAGDQIDRLENLAAQIADWNGVMTHEAFVEGISRLVAQRRPR